MKALSYIIAAILVIDWFIGYIVYDAGRGIHLLPVMAFAVVIQQIIQSNRYASRLFNSHPKRHTGNFHLTEKH